MRLDQWLVKSGMARSRQQAHQLILEGSVSVNGVKAIKPALVIRQDLDNIQVAESPLLQFVSRGGVKLRGALDHLGFEVRGLSVLDIGISTGGFTDCLLQAGVASVLGVDVGRDQLSDRLRYEARLRHLEGQNIRDLTPERLKKLGLPQSFPLVVIDVSFISLEKVLGSAWSLLAPGGKLLALVKPQFEVGPENLNAKGLVKDKACYGMVEERMRRVLEDLGGKVLDYFPASITGSDGNQEFFVFSLKTV